MNTLSKNLLCTEILRLGVIGIVALSMQPRALAIANPLLHHDQPQVSTEVEQQPQRMTQSNDAAAELDAYQSSRYDYWDARVLANLWGQSVYDSKLRIGRKILWGSNDVLYLEQMLVDAQVDYLQSIQLENTPANYVLYQDSQYSYDDAELLAKWWNGAATPETIMESKYRIERNLALSNDELLDRTLSQARRQYSQ